MAEIVKAPNDYPVEEHTIFLAGSIEMGAAENWQDKITDLLKDEENMVILNPRRDDWDSSWEQSIENPQFKEQVCWELEALEDSSRILMYFDPNTKSPITLLELGIYAGMDPTKIVVCCSEGFWRKGNVDIVCWMYGIRQVETIEELAAEAK
jgi:hypothetical protein